MLLKQTNLKQTGAVVVDIEGEKTVMPLFSLDFDEEIQEIIKLTNGKVDKFSSSSLLESAFLMEQINTYKKEHKGCAPKEIMDDIRLGFRNTDKYIIRGYC